MAFNINSFRQYGLTEGGARPSLFEVNFPVMPGSTNTNQLQRLSALCQSASLPASNVSEIDVAYFGRRIKFSGERIFDDWTVTVINDEDFSARDMFEAWSNYINKLVDNTNSSQNENDYKLDGVEVFQYGKGGEIIRSYMFFGMWPKTVSDIRLDWGQTNQMETFEVRFAVDFWIPTIADGSIGTVGYSASDSSLGSVAGGVPPSPLVST